LLKALGLASASDNSFKAGTSPKIYINNFSLHATSRCRKVRFCALAATKGYSAAS